MPSTRSSTRQAATASSSQSSSQVGSVAKSGSAGSKRKSDAITGSTSKHKKKSDDKEQTTIEDTLQAKKKDIDSEDVDMKDEESLAALDDKEALEALEAAEADASSKRNGYEDLQKREIAVTAREDAIKDKEDNLKGGKLEDNGSDKEQEANNRKPSTNHDDYTSNVEKPKAIERDVATDLENEGDSTNANNAVEKSSKREDSTPSSILEKGLIYFFFRGRVGIDEPSDVSDVARSYIVLRPIPHGSKLGDGSIGDAGTYRLLALPKKVLPTSPKDRFMVFVEKANVSLEDIKSTLASTDYMTQTAGSRHTPAATPIGEGVYAITTTGRESHLAYILTIPSELSEVQKDVGLHERDSFVTSAKNPQYPGPANASLPQSPEFPKECVYSRTMFLSLLIML